GELPSSGHADAGGEHDLVGFRAFGIEHHEVPRQDCELCGGGGRTGSAVFLWQQVVEGRFHGGYACGDVAVESVEIDVVAAPRDFPAVAAELHACDVHNGTVGRMFAGNPFRIHQCEGTGLHRKFHFCVVDAARGVAEVDFEFYDWILRLRCNGQD